MSYYRVTLVAALSCHLFPAAVQAQVDEALEQQFRARSVELHAALQAGTSTVLDTLVTEQFGVTVAYRGGPMIFFPRDGLLLHAARLAAGTQLDVKLVRRQGDLVIVTSHFRRRGENAIGWSSDVVVTDVWLLVDESWRLAWRTQAEPRSSGP